jgi:hypothetical protein
MSGGDALTAEQEQIWVDGWITCYHDLWDTFAKANPKSNAALRDRLARAEERERALRETLTHIEMVADSIWVDCVTGAADVADPVPMKAESIMSRVKAALAARADGAAADGDAVGGERDG